MLIEDLKPGCLIQTSSWGAVFKNDTIFEVVESFDHSTIPEGMTFVLVWCPTIDLNGRPAPYAGRDHIHGYTLNDKIKTLQHGQCWARIDQNTKLVHKWSK